MQLGFGLALDSLYREKKTCGAQIIRGEISAVTWSPVCVNITPVEKSDHLWSLK